MWRLNWKLSGPELEVDDFFTTPSFGSLMAVLASVEEVGTGP
jgi:hypothetical protein